MPAPGTKYPISTGLIREWPPNTPHFRRFNTLRLEEKGRTGLPIEYHKLFEVAYSTGWRMKSSG
jgi:hypothetical protein